MEAKVRDDILDRVMGVLVQEEGGRKVLSKRVEKIMLSYANVRKINEEETSPASEDSFSESEDALQSNISAERQKLQQSFSEEPSSQDQPPRTPSPSHYLPDDFLPLRNLISAERPTLQHSFPEDSSSQEDEHPLTPSPRHYLPDDFIPLQPAVQESISSERLTLQHSPPHLPRKKTVPATGISSERPTLKQSSNPQPPHLPRKRTAQPPSTDAQPPSKKAKKKPNTVTYVKMESPEEYKENIRKRIDTVLKKASAGGTVLEIPFFWLGAQDSQFFLAPKARKSRHLLHRDKSA